MREAKAHSVRPCRTVAAGRAPRRAAGDGSARQAGPRSAAAHARQPPAADRRADAVWPPAHLRTEPDDQTARLERAIERLADRAAGTAARAWSASRWCGRPRAAAAGCRDRCRRRTAAARPHQRPHHRHVVVPARQLEHSHRLAGQPLPRSICASPEVTMKRSAAASSAPRSADRCRPAPASARLVRHARRRPAWPGYRVGCGHDERSAVPGGLGARGPPEFAGRRLVHDPIGATAAVQKQRRQPGAQVGRQPSAASARSDTVVPAVIGPATCSTLRADRQPVVGRGHDQVEQREGPHRAGRAGPAWCGHPTGGGSSAPRAGCACRW